MAGSDSSLFAGNKSHAEWEMLPIRPSHQMGELVAVAGGERGGGWLHGKIQQIKKCELGTGCCPAI